MSTLPAAAQVADLSPYQGIVLVSFGGPERIEEVMPFLRTVTRGRGIPDERLAEVAEHYYHRGGRSPINDENRALLAALQGELGRRGCGYRCCGATGTRRRPLTRPSARLANEDCADWWRW